MKSIRASNRVADVAREELCRQLASLLQDGVNHVRVRLHWQGSLPDQAWFYARENNHWQKQAAALTLANLVAALHKELERLASRGQCADVTVHKTLFAEATDFEFQFCREALNAHPSVPFDAKLYGMLFRDPHASANDVRRSPGKTR